MSKSTRTVEREEKQRGQRALSQRELREARTLQRERVDLRQTVVGKHQSRDDGVYDESRERKAPWSVSDVSDGILDTTWRSVCESEATHVREWSLTW